MKSSTTTTQIYIIILSFISLILFILVIKYGNYLIESGIIVEVEGFDQYASAIQDIGDSSTTHTINLPINTKYSCENVCGPLARCSITGEQCSTDVDCYGCRPELKPSDNRKSDNIGGQNDAGKLTAGVTPTYSVLTTDIGTRAKLVEAKLTPPPQYYQGVNLWRDAFNIGQELFDKRYNPGSVPYMPQYPERTTLSGQFIDNGPLAANAFL